MLLGTQEFLCLSPSGDFFNTLGYKANSQQSKSTSDLPSTSDLRAVIPVFRCFPAAVYFFPTSALFRPALSLAARNGIIGANR